MSASKPYKVCNFSRQESYGVVAPSLSQLKDKGSKALGFSAATSLSLVLDDDGTIVQDEAYFSCLPPNTKFMFLQENEKWIPPKRYDGGTAWLRQSTIDTDTVDSPAGGVEAWRGLANQLKQDLSSIILMSEANLQTLVDVPCPVLAAALAFSEQKTQDLQSTLQRALDRREEERQSKDLLQLYLEVVEKERSVALLQGTEQVSGGNSHDEIDGLDVNSALSLNTLSVLKGKTSPETRLSNEQLQMVLKQGVQIMMKQLGWDRVKTTALLQACEGELNQRLLQVRAMQSLSAHSQRNTTSPT